MKTLLEFHVLEEEILKDENDDKVVCRVFVEEKSEKVISGKSYPIVKITSLKSHARLEKGKTYLAEVKITVYERSVFFKILKAKELK